MVDNNAALKQIFARFMGQHNTLVVYRPFVDFMGGDHAGALFLSQLVYWSDRTSDPEGWFYKSYAEWEFELGVSRYQSMRIIKECEGMGFLQTKVKKANGVPTVHFLFDFDKFAEVFIGHLTGVAGEPEPAQPEPAAQKKKTAAKKTAAPALQFDIPDHLNQPAFVTIFTARWPESRARNRKPLTQTAVNGQLAMLAEYDLKTAVQMVQNAINGDWMGIFPIKGVAKRSQGQPGPAALSDDVIEAMNRALNGEMK